MSKSSQDSRSTIKRRKTMHTTTNFTTKLELQKLEKKTLPELMFDRIVTIKTTE